jgi:hypothetical protein
MPLIPQNYHKSDAESKMKGFKVDCVSIGEAEKTILGLMITRITHNYKTKKSKVFKSS